MCYPVTCATCEKTTWAGCGQHADSIMRAVPAPHRCTCTERVAAQSKPGFFRTLFGH